MNKHFPTEGNDALATDDGTWSISCFNAKLKHTITKLGYPRGNIFAKQKTSLMSFLVVEQWLFTEKMMKDFQKRNYGISRKQDVIHERCHSF